MSKRRRHHCSQYADGASSVTRHAGCTWTSLASGIGTTTTDTPSPDDVHKLVPPEQETNPKTPGWSLPDAVLAAKRAGVELEDCTGDGWDGLSKARANGQYALVQGDSDRFGNNTCSGAFDGDHCIGVHPDTRFDDQGNEEWWIDDPICPEGRWERERVVRDYAEKLSSGIRFAVFADPVPLEEPEPVNPTPGTGVENVTVMYVPPFASTQRMRLAKGQKCYASPGGQSVTTISKAGAVQHVGFAGNVDGEAWRAVIVVTGVPYSDKQARRTVLYVPAAAGPLVEA